MNDQNPITEAPEAEAKKSRFSIPFRAKDGSTTASTAAPKSLKDKAGTALKVVGVVTLVGGAAAFVANRRGVKGVTLDLPDVDVTTESA